MWPSRTQLTCLATLRCLMAAALASAVTLGLAGCAATETETETGAEVLALGERAPDDFVLEVWVDAPRRGANEVAAERRPGYFVVFPDGTLHHGRADVPVVTMDGIDRLPPEVRTLDERDVEQLWGLVSAIGEPSPASAPADDVVYEITVMADEVRWSQSVDGSNPEGRQLVRRLAALAWVPDEPQPKRLTIPRRYDFGSDPYARYAPPQ